MRWSGNRSRVWSRSGSRSSSCIGGSRSCSGRRSRSGESRSCRSCRSNRIREEPAAGEASRGGQEAPGSPQDTWQEQEGSQHLSDYLTPEVWTKLEIVIFKTIIVVFQLAAPYDLARVRQSVTEEDLEDTEDDNQGDPSLAPWHCARL